MRQDLKQESGSSWSVGKNNNSGEEKIDGRSSKNKNCIGTALAINGERAIMYTDLA